MIKKQMIMVFICILSGCFLLTACRKEDKKDQENTTEETSKETISPTVTPAVQTEDTIDQSIDTDTKETEEQTKTEEYISEKEAVKYIQDIVGDRGYYFEVLDDNLVMEDKNYYVYQISDSGGPIEPNVLVNKLTGELSCYYSDGSTAAFSEHPLYAKPETKEEPDAVSSGEISQDDALDMLNKVSAKDLGLTEELSEYTIVFDEWTTNINAKECYGINAYTKAEERMINVGRFYVATDGSAMYKFDSLLDDFVELKK